MTKRKSKPKADLKEEIDLLDTMLTSLVELLEQKGILSARRMGTQNREKRQDIVSVIGESGFFR